MPSAPPTGARAPIGQGSPSAFGVFVARPGADPIPPPGAAGSSSMLQRLTVRLAETLSLVDPRRTAGAPANRRLLTKPSTRCSKRRRRRPPARVLCGWWRRRPRAHAVAPRSRPHRTPLRPPASASYRLFHTLSPSLSPRARRPHDNELGDLVVSVSDVIENGETGEGFEVLSALGKGTFGQARRATPAPSRPPPSAYPPHSPTPLPPPSSLPLPPPPSSLR